MLFVANVWINWGRSAGDTRARVDRVLAELKGCFNAADVGEPVSGGMLMQDVISVRFPDPAVMNKGKARTFFYALQKDIGAEIVPELTLENV